MYLLTIGADTFTSPGRSGPAQPEHSEPNIHSGQRTKNFFWHISMSYTNPRRQRWEKIMLKFPTFSPRDVCPGLPGSHTDTARVRVSSVSCPGSPGSSSAPRGKTDPSLGSCPNLFLGYVFARLASARTRLSSSHQSSSWFLTHTASPHHWDGNEGFLSTFSPAACTRIVGDAKGCMNHALYWKVVRVSENGNALFIMNKSWQCSHEGGAAPSGWPGLTCAT